MYRYLLCRNRGPEDGERPSLLTRATKAAQIIWLSLWSVRVGQEFIELMNDYEVPMSALWGLLL
jgi:hypothetical protein